jgi:hypothetical protein
MKRTRLAVTALSPTVVLLALALGAPAEAKTITISSGKYWTVTNAAMADLGNAQNVCRYPTAPEGCPSGATLFGATTWVAIPSANWIWDGRTMPTSSAAVNTQLTLKTPFFLCGNPQSGTLKVAADNAADVLINGSPVLSTVSFSTVTTVSTPTTNLALQKGLNMIEAKVTNGANPPTCSDQYQCNPAGVVVQLSVTDDLNPWPTCMDGTKVFQVGEFEDLPCPPGQVGSNTRVCVCLAGGGFWWQAANTCHVPPVTCTGSNNIPFNVGDRETVSCPQGTLGSAFRTCQPNGTWGTPDTSGCQPPPVTCTGSNNVVFAVGARETLPCPPGKVGGAFRTCQANGSWSAPDTSGCALPTVGVGAMCGSTATGQTANCPTGTTCQHRVLPTPPRDLWCAVFGINCPVRLWTTDWFCD